MADIESERNECDEFSLESPGSWKSDGSVVSSGPRVVVSRFYPKKVIHQHGWIVSFNDDAVGDGLLFASGNNESRFIKGFMCGAPVAIQARCIIPSALALDAIEEFLATRARSSKHTWLAWEDSFGDPDP